LAVDRKFYPFVYHIALTKCTIARPTAAFAGSVRPTLQRAEPELGDSFDESTNLVTLNATRGILPNWHVAGTALDPVDVVEATLSDNTEGCVERPESISSHVRVGLYDMSSAQWGCCSDSAVPFKVARKGMKVFKPISATESEKTIAEVTTTKSSEESGKPAIGEAPPSQHPKREPENVNEDWSPNPKRQRHSVTISHLGVSEDCRTSKDVVVHPLPKRQVLCHSHSIHMLIIVRAQRFPWALTHPTLDITYNPAFKEPRIVVFEGKSYTVNPDDVSTWGIQRLEASWVPSVSDANVKDTAYECLLCRSKFVKGDERSRSMQRHFWRWHCDRVYFFLCPAGRCKRKYGSRFSLNRHLFGNKEKGTTGSAECRVSIANGVFREGAPMLPAGSMKACAATLDEDLRCISELGEQEDGHEAIVPAQGESKECEAKAA